VGRHDVRRRRVSALWPIAPWCVRPDRSRQTGEVFYRVSLPDGTPAATLPAYRMFHLMGYTDNGYEGKSVLAHVRESVGLGLAVEEFGARYFAQGTHMGGFLEVPGRLSGDASARLKADLNEKYQGLGRSHRVIVLEEGAKYASVAIPPNDSQMLETRRFQTEEIARFYRVPPHLIQSLERSTNNNIEHQGIDFVTHCIQPWVVKWEMAIARQLLSPAERAAFFAKFNLASLLRGDTKSRYEAYAVGRQWGWLSANDIRELEDLDRLPGGQGDMYLVPMNMVPADRVGDVVDAQIASGAGAGAVGAEESRAAGGAAPTVGAAETAVVKKNESRAAGGGRPGVTRAALRLAFERQGIARENGAVFEAAARRLLAVESYDVESALRDVLDDRGTGALERWLQKYYKKGVFPAKAAEALEDPVEGHAAAVRAYATRLRDSLAQELADAGRPAPSMTDEQVAAFARAYLDGFVRRYAYRSRKLLAGVAFKASEAGGGKEGVAAAVRKELASWAAGRPAKVGGDDATRMGGEFTRAAAERAGMLVRWVTHGGNSCPLCASMNGRVVGRAGTFGDPSNPRVGKRRGPPLHTGCRCSLALEPAGGHARPEPTSLPSVKGLHSTDDSGKIVPEGSNTVIDSVEHFDFNDGLAVKKALNDFCNRFADAAKEHALVITRDNKAYHLTGNGHFVDPEVIGIEKLRGSIVIHNHPLYGNKEKYDSFSLNDFQLVARNKIKKMHLVSGTRRETIEVAERISETEIWAAYKQTLIELLDNAANSGVRVVWEQEQICRILAQSNRGIRFYDHI
jgi:HK97 family phage portal protein